MPKLLFCTWEVEDGIFYLFNAIFDIVFSVLLASVYLLLVHSRETQFFLFIMGCISLVASVITLVYYIIDECFTTNWHKHYFEIRAIVSAVLFVLFISATINLFFEGKNLFILMSSFLFLIANTLLIFTFLWSVEMLESIKRLRAFEARRKKEEAEDANLTKLGVDPATARKINEHREKQKHEPKAKPVAV